jgi:hypothetical protein
MASVFEALEICGVFGGHKVQEPIFSCLDDSFY